MKLSTSFTSWWENAVRENNIILDMKKNHGGEVTGESSNMCLYVTIINPAVCSQGEAGEKGKGIVEILHLHTPLRQVQSELRNVLIESGENSQAQSGRGFLQISHRWPWMTLQWHNLSDGNHLESRLPCADISNIRRRHRQLIQVDFSELHAV